MAYDRTLLTDDQIAAEQLADWRQLPGNVLAARFATGDFETGMRLISFVAATAEEQDHHPDIDLRYSYVEIRTTSHDAHGITSRDITLARAVSEYAAGDHLAVVSPDPAVE